MLFITDFLSSATPLAVILIKLGLCLLSGGLIGLERGRHGRTAGFRTHILVCLGATLAAMLDLYTNFSMDSDGTRIAAQVVTGIGFLGAGAILIKRDHTITGLTTAAGLWATGIIGLAYGYGYYEAALFATVVLLITHTLLLHLESTKTYLAFYIEVDDLGSVNVVMRKLKEKCPMAHLEVVPAKSGDPAHLGIRMDFTKKRARASNQSKSHLEEFLEIEHIIYVVSE